jgi:hypothetical protein
VITLKLGNQETTLNQRDAVRLIEGMMLAIKDPAGMGSTPVHLGDITLTANATKAGEAKKFSTERPLLTDC